MSILGHIRYSSTALAASAHILSAGPIFAPEPTRDDREGRSDPPDKGPVVPLGGWPKRAADILIAIAALLLAAPVMLSIAILIRASSRGPVLFAHRRVGFGGRTFQCYKFRTMVPNAEAVLEEYLASNPEAAAEWRESQKLRHDPRTNFIGLMLRKASLDELPQFYNVLRGDMSCVGPRPIVRDELQRYGTFADYYLRTRPGLTGLWQVTGRSNTDYDKRVSLDTQYVRTWSFWADMVILCRTPLAVGRVAQVY